MITTVGVEEELLLLDEVTGAPRAVAVEVEREDEDGRTSAELQQEQIEIGSRPCVELAELADQLARRRRYVDGLARRQGARAAALGTSPVPADPTVTTDPRYQAMITHYGLTTAEQLTCGCHVHVGVADRAAGVRALDGVRGWLPVLLACSANSPYWQGQDTGYASFRSQAWNRFPSAGPADHFGDLGAYESRLDTMIDSGAVLDRKMIYFDARLSESYPTVEIRVADVCLDLADTVLIAALARALVATALAGTGSSGPAPDPVPTGLLRLASWRAGRSGLAGELIDPVTLRPRPAAAVIDALLEHVGAALVAAGDHDRVRDRLDRLVELGTGADRQRHWFATHGELAAVARAAADATLA